MATKEKINLLEVIPCRNEHIKAEQEGETIVLSSQTTFSMKQATSLVYLPIFPNYRKTDLLNG